MATLVSSPTTVTVMAQGSSALSKLAASMGRGTWRELPTNGLVTAFGSGSNNILVYSSKGAWDPLHRKAHFVGQYHGDGKMRHVTYDELTNAWTITHSTIGDPGGHGFDGIQVHPTTGDIYFMPYGQSNSLYGKAWGESSWNLNRAPNPGLSSGAMFATAMWTGPLSGVTGGKGAMMVYELSFGYIRAFDIGANIWRTVDDSPVGFPSGGYHQVAGYSPSSNAMIFGGGNSNPTGLYRYNSDMSITNLSSIIPSGVTFGIYQSTFVEEPATGRFLIMRNGNLWELNPEGVGSITLQTGTRVPPAVVNQTDPTTNSSVIGIPISNYGVVMFVSMDVGPTGNVFLYKH